MNYDSIIYWCDIGIVIGYCALILSMWYYFTFFALSFKKAKKYPKGTKKYKYCVIVPARNEDKVIGSILKSLKEQTYDKKCFDVYVIVESKDDPTIKITKKYGYKTFVRVNLAHRATKGFAIQEFIRNLNSTDKNNYDAYMIFDADNLMDKDYIEKMNDLKNAGFQVGFGNRNFTNANENWITQCSALLFSILNSVFSKGRSVLFKKILVNGTGYFVDKNIIDDIGDWIFVGMTEDVQFSTYCTYHNIKMGYYEDAQYYDEEPTDFKTMHKQHVRWIWGFLASRKAFTKKTPNYHANKESIAGLARFEFNCSIIPIVIYIVLALLAYIAEFCLWIYSFVDNPAFSGWLFGHMQIPFFSIYFLFFLTAILLIINDNKKHFKFSFWQCVRSIFVFTFYFLDFISAFFDGLTHPRKRKTWDAIKHVGKVTGTDAKEAEK